MWEKVFQKDNASTKIYSYQETKAVSIDSNRYKASLKIFKHLYIFRNTQDLCLFEKGVNTCTHTVVIKVFKAK